MPEHCAQPAQAVRLPRPEQLRTTHLSATPQVNACNGFRWRSATRVAGKSCLRRDSNDRHFAECDLAHGGTETTGTLPSASIRASKQRNCVFCRLTHACCHAALMPDCACLSVHRPDQWRGLGGQPPRSTRPGIPNSLRRRKYVCVHAILELLDGRFGFEIGREARALRLSPQVQMYRLLG